MNKKLLKGLMLSAVLAIGSNLSAQTYCTVSTTSAGDRLSEVNSVGAVTNINYTSSTSPAGSYADETAQTFESYATQTFTINTTYVGGSNGVNVWVDWNNDGTFDAAELVGSQAGTAASKALSLTIPVGTPVDDYRMRVRGQYGATANPPACGNVAWGSTVDFTLSILSPPSCLAPTALTASNFTATSVDLAWTENNTATAWNIEYGAPGFTLGSGTPVPATTNPYTLTIPALSSFEFYVQSDCGGGDLSAWAGPFFFSNDYCTVSTQFGEYLTVIETDGANLDVNYAATTQPTGSYANETTQIIESFETQSFDFNTTYSSGSNGVNIWVDWNNDFTFDQSELLASQASSNASKTIPVMIPAGTAVGNYRMRVRGQWGSTSNPPACGSVNYGSTVDFTLNIVSPPSCLPVLDIDTLSTSTTSVELEWVELNGATSWNIEYGLSGFTLGAGTPATATTNPFTVTGLVPSTQYDFYVQSVCSVTDQSTWSGPFSVYTACGIAVAPYYEGFNNAIEPQCWENMTNGTSGTNNVWLFDGAPGNGAAPAINGRPSGTFAWADGSYSDDSTMLTTPQIDVSQLTSPYLAFEWFSSNTNTPGDTHPLIVEVFDGTTWNLLDTLLADSSEWMFVNYDLGAYANSIIKVRFMVNQNTTTSSAFYTDILLDDIRIDDCISLGGQDGSVDVCRLDKTIDLNTIIVKPNGGGTWSFPSQPSYISNDSIFNFELLPAGSYEVYYTERFVCYDTTFATINVFNTSSAGFDGAVTVCKNEPINLFGSLSGNADLGGQWYDFTNTLLPNSQPKAQSIPGQYNYFYVASNGVCPADTAIVTVEVLSDCDFLSIPEEMFTDISVFPNPATTQINIVNPSNTSSLKVEMLDMNGRVVLVENKALNDASEATLAIDHLEKGIYTLRVYNNEGQKTFKVVKQ